LLKLEQKANDVFSQYVHLYYDFAVSSVYLCDSEQHGFSGCFLVKKELHDQKEIKYGCWDAIHVVTCAMQGGKAGYTVISTVMITLDAHTDSIGKMTIAGSSAKTASCEVAMDAGFNADPSLAHIRNIGRMIESNESVFRNDVSESYISKQRQITNSGRLMEEYMSKDEKSAF
jgi:capping protein (actin filament) muscle Z-line, beta